MRYYLESKQGLETNSSLCLAFLKKKDDFQYKHLTWVGWCASPYCPSWYEDFKEVFGEESFKIVKDLDDFVDEDTYCSYSCNDKVFISTKFPETSWYLAASLLRTPSEFGHKEQDWVKIKRDLGDKFSLKEKMFIATVFGTFFKKGTVLTAHMAGQGIDYMHEGFYSYINNLDWFNPRQRIFKGWVYTRVYSSYSYPEKTYDGYIKYILRSR